MKHFRGIKKMVKQTGHGRCDCVQFDGKTYCIVVGMMVL